MQLGSISSAMRVLIVLVALPLLAMSASDQAQQGVSSPAIQKVIQMLSDMEAKAKKEKNEEEVAFAEFAEWCKLNTASLKKSVKKAKSEIDELGTSIDKLNSEAKTLGEDIGKLGNTIAKHEADMKARKNSRAKDHKEYVEESTDYAESISALDRAVAVMSDQDYDRKGASAALLQVSQTQNVPARVKELIASFLGEDSDDSEDGPGYQAPEANAYEFQSGGVVSMLKSLLEDFRGKKVQCDKEEANAKHAHDMVMLDLSEAVDDAEREVSSKTATKGAKQAKSAKQMKQKKGTEGTLAEDESTLKDMEAECSEKTESFKSKQQLRADEIEAIGKAIAIMGSDKVAFIASPRSAMSLAQLRSGSKAQLQGRHKDVRDFIVKEGQRLKSHTLSLLAQKLEADPFAKVTGMIKDMLERLLKEANEDAEHSGFCDTEMSKSKTSRTQLSEDIDALTASVEDAKATVMSLSEQNADLAKEVGELTTAKGEASKMRNAENKKNKETVVDADAAAKATEAAVSVLKDFYAKAGEAQAFVQGGASDEAAPKQTFGDVYKGNQDSATGVLAMLDVIRSDFANLSADTKASEEASVKAYDEFMVETKKNLAMKSKKIELNEADLAETNKKMTEDKKDLKTNQEMLVTAERYFEKLTAQCVDKGSSYEERTKARAAEIESLKQALQMLS